MPAGQAYSNIASNPLANSCELLHLAAMWTAILGIIGSLLSWITKKDERDVSHDDGVREGQSAQKAADQAEVIKEDQHVIQIQHDMASVPPVDDDAALARLRSGKA